MTRRRSRPDGQSMNLEERIRRCEQRLFAQLGVSVRERFVRLDRSGPTVRVLGSGSGPPVVLLHGVTQSAAVWTPLFPYLPGYRLLAVDLPGHGLSSPMHFRPRHRPRAGQVAARPAAGRPLARAGASNRPLAGGDVRPLARGERSREDLRAGGGGRPAVALPGVRVRMPLSLLTLPGLGEVLLRVPGPRLLYRAQLVRGLGRDEAGAMPDALLDALRLAMRRPSNAHTVAGLMHALNRFRTPRPESVLSDARLLSALGVPRPCSSGATLIPTYRRARPQRQLSN